MLKSEVFAFDDDNNEVAEVGTNTSYATYRSMWPTNAKYHLQLKREVNPECERCRVPASNWELCSYLRSYFRLSMLFLDGTNFYENFNLMVWIWTLMTIMKILPITYVHIVFAKFSPHNHYFLPKILPVLQGTKFISIITSVAMSQIVLLEFLSNSIVMKDSFVQRSPWNRCTNKVIKIGDTDTRCYEIAEYLNLLDDEAPVKVTSIADSSTYMFTSAKRNESFVLAPLGFVTRQYQTKDEATLCWDIAVAVFFITLVMAVTKDRIFNRCIWKAITYVHIFYVFVHVFMWLHMIYVSVQNELSDYKNKTSSISTETIFDRTYHNHNSVNKVHVLNSDIWIVSQTLTCPPLIHFLAARSNNRISPNSASTVIVLFNSIYMFSVGRLAYKVNLYLLSKFFIDINCQPHYASCPETTSYPLYFSTFYFGELFYFLYGASRILDTMISLVITVHILFETIICEWKWINWWGLLTIWCLTSHLVYTSVCINHLLIIKVIAKQLQFKLVSWYTFLNVVEMFAITFLYPFQRLTDDILFQFGFPSTLFRKVTYTMGFFCFVLSLTLAVYVGKNVMKNRMKDDSLPEYLHINSDIKVILPLFAFILILGAVYATIKMVFIEKKSWRKLFNPTSDWGPYDHKLRTQRKQYIGSEYIESQAPRDLSRTMIKRRNQDVYSLKIDYIGRGSTVSALSYTNEKKIK